MRTAMAVLVSASTLIACDSGNRRPPPEAPAVVGRPDWQRQSVTFYLPPRIIEQRLSSSALSGYIKALSQEASKAFAARQDAWGASGMVVFIVQPGGRSRVWIVTGQPSLEQPVVDAITQRLEAVPAPQVTGGPVAIGVEFKFKGGGALPEGMPMPIPESWQALIPPPGARMDDALLEKIWSEG